MMGAIIVFAAIAALVLAIDPFWVRTVHRLEERASRKISDERMAEAREEVKP